MSVNLCRKLTSDTQFSHGITTFTPPSPHPVQPLESTNTHSVNQSNTFTKSAATGLFRNNFKHPVNFMCSQKQLGALECPTRQKGDSMQFTALAARRNKLLRTQTNKEPESTHVRRITERAVKGVAKFYRALTFPLILICQVKAAPTMKYHKNTAWYHRGGL